MREGPSAAGAGACSALSYDFLSHDRQKSSLANCLVGPLFSQPWCSGAFMSGAKNSHARLLWTALAVAGFAIARLAPPLEGLTRLGQSVLGAAIAGTVLWVSEAIPIGLTALVVTALLGLCPGLHAPDVARGFASEVVLFLIGAVGLGAAVESSGLAVRVARFLSGTAVGSPARLCAQMIAGLPLLALLIPSAITRNAVLIPAYRNALGAMGLDQSSRAGRAIMLALGILNPLASSAFLTGGITSITASTLIGGFSWLGWFSFMAVPYYGLLCGGAILVWLLVGGLEGAGREVKPQAAGPPYTAAEKRTLIVLALTAGLWLTDSIHRISPAIPPCSERQSSCCRASASSRGRPSNRACRGASF
ncbi:MAG TPA: SLC13 family permease [Hyphomicrobiaceae bacterium]|nr:SLC13 family permease [Hyphomicrobiaceae bacterium]